MWTEDFLESPLLGYVDQDINVLGGRVVRYRESKGNQPGFYIP